MLILKSLVRHVKTAASCAEQKRRVDARTKLAVEMLEAMMVVVIVIGRLDLALLTSSRRPYQIIDSPPSSPR